MLWAASFSSSLLPRKRQFQVWTAALPLSLLLPYIPPPIVDLPPFPVSLVSNRSKFRLGTSGIQTVFVLFSVCVQPLAHV